MSEKTPLDLAVEAYNDTDKMLMETTIEKTEHIMNALDSMSDAIASLRLHAADIEKEVESKR